MVMGGFIVMVTGMSVSTDGDKNVKDEYRIIRRAHEPIVEFDSIFKEVTTL